MSLSCKIGLHKDILVTSHVVTIEDGMKKLWVVNVCNECKTFKKIGLAHETKAQPDDKPTHLQDYKWRYQNAK